MHMLCLWQHVYADVKLKNSNMETSASVRLFSSIAKGFTYNLVANSKFAHITAMITFFLC